MRSFSERAEAANEEFAVVTGELAVTAKDLAAETGRLSVDRKFHSFSQIRDDFYLNFENFTNFSRIIILAAVKYVFLNFTPLTS